MIHLLDMDNSGYDLVSLPEILPDARAHSCPKCGSQRCSHCGQADAFHPEPQLSGNLQVDPEIILPSPGMNVEIGYYYNAASSYNGPFGYGRTISPNLTIQASGSPLVVTLTRGNGAIATYQGDSLGTTFTPFTPGELNNTLQKDTVNNQWKETTPDGYLTAYPLDTSGMVTSVTYVQDSVGNTHSHAYDTSGRLQSIQETMGRKVSFSYGASNLLSAIQDWAGRLTSFQYDTTSLAGKPALTTVIGPSGCQTVDAYTFPVGGSPLLTGIIDPNGQGTSNTYGVKNRVVNRIVQGVGIKAIGGAG